MKLVLGMWLEGSNEQLNLLFSILVSSKCSSIFHYVYVLIMFHILEILQDFKA